MTSKLTENTHIAALCAALLNYGKDVAPNIKISFPQVDGADICRISVTPTPRAVCVKDGDDERFFIRTGNSKRRLSVGEVVQYCKRRWPA